MCEQRDIEGAIEIHVEKTAERGTWREPWRNIFRLFSTHLGSLIYGMNDSTVGLKFMMGSINYTAVSLIFLAPTIGCVLVAFLTNRLHSKIGRRGVGLLSCGYYIIVYAIVSFHPPFPVLFLLYIITDFGSGLMNGSWNSSFWEETGPVYCEHDAGPSGMTGGRTLKVTKSKVTLLLSAFMLLYLGCELSIGGWIVLGLELVASGFWIGCSNCVTTGLTLGRFALGWVTGHFEEFLLVMIYIILPIGWLTAPLLVNSQFVVSAVMVAMIEDFIGMPMPEAIVVVTKTVPPELHVIAVGFSAVFSVSGSAVVQILQPIFVALLTAQLGLWFFVPRVAEEKQAE
ncbi:hypothetical protein DFP73DRAFT_571183 [Morchella snyderi]|nr:hypothetical protein DFP73DRAFT_571183 [Morchella snyderi]